MLPYNKHVIISDLAKRFFSHTLYKQSRMPRSIVLACTFEELTCAFSYVGQQILMNVNGESEVMANLGFSCRVCLRKNK